MHKLLFCNKFIICLYTFRALCAHHQEVKIVLHSIWYHHTCRWPSGARGRTPTAETSAIKPLKTGILRLTFCVIRKTRILHLTFCIIRSRDTSVGLANRYGLDGPGIESRCGGEIFRTHPDRPWDSPSLT